MATIIATLGAFALILISQSMGASATNPDASMRVTVTGGDVPCGGVIHDANEVCVPLDGQFTAAVEITNAPAIGYVLFVTWLEYGTLVYNPTVAAFDEFTWPECNHFTDVRTELTAAVVHVCGTGPLPPLRPSTYKGELLNLSFACPSEDSSSRLRLLPWGDPTASLAGTRLFDSMLVDTFQVPKLVGQIVNCGAAGGPLPTIVPSPTPTTSPTPTPTVTPAAVGGFALDQEQLAAPTLEADGSAPGYAWWFIAGISVLALAITAATVIARRASSWYRVSSS